MGEIFLLFVYLLHVRLVLGLLFMEGLLQVLLYLVNATFRRVKRLGDNVLPIPSQVQISSLKRLRHNEAMLWPA